MTSYLNTAVAVLKFFYFLPKGLVYILLDVTQNFCIIRVLIGSFKII